MPSQRPRPRDRMRLVALLLLFTLALAACGGADPSPTFRLPTFSVTIPPVAGLELEADRAARERLHRLLAGELVVEAPSLLAWEDVERLTLPSDVRPDAFCTALGTPGADDLLTGLIVAGLNVVARRRSGGNISQATEDVLGLVVKFTTGTCPAWKPALMPVPTLAPLPAPPLPAFTALARDPGIGYRVVPRAEIACPPSLAFCWQAELFAMRGCPTYAEMSLAVTDAAGVPLGYAVDWRNGVAPGVVERFSFAAEAGDHLNQGVYAVTCY